MPEDRSQRTTPKTQKIKLETECQRNKVPEWRIATLFLCIFVTLYLCSLEFIEVHFDNHARHMDVILNRMEQ